MQLKPDRTVIERAAMDAAESTVVNSAGDAQAAAVVADLTWWQDPVRLSLRVWAAVVALLGAVLALPEVQAIIISHAAAGMASIEWLAPWSPVVTQALAAALALASKAKDRRPVRPQ